MFTDLRNYILALRSAKSAQDRARAKASKVLAQARADAAAAAQRVIDVADNDKRINYYHQADFERYQSARAANSRGPDGILPWVNPDDFTTPWPTPEQWSTLSQEQKQDGGLTRV